MTGSSNSTIDTQTKCYANADHSVNKALTDCYVTPKASDTFFQMEIAPIFVIGCSIFSVFWGTVAALLIRRITMSEDNTEFIQKRLDEFKKNDEYWETNPDAERPNSALDILKQMNNVGEKITTGAKEFLKKEYIYLFVWSFGFSIVLACTVDMLEMANPQNPTDFPYTATSYLIGSITSIIAGWIGMRIAVYTNTRVTFMCCEDTHKGFITAFRGGQVLGFVLVGLALLNLMIIVLIFKSAWWTQQADDIWADATVGLSGAANSTWAAKQWTFTGEVMKCVN